MDMVIQSETTKGIFNCLTLQKQFMEAAGQVTDGSSEEVYALYKTLVDEELDEFKNAETKLEKVKEACDVIVVGSGFVISQCGYKHTDIALDLFSGKVVKYLCDELGTEKAQKAYELVHASNMEKLVGKVERREDGKILKNENFKTQIKEKLMADLANLIEN
jgi:hypothetical protein